MHGSNVQHNYLSNHCSIKEVHCIFLTTVITADVYRFLHILLIIHSCFINIYIDGRESCGNERMYAILGYINLAK